MKSISYTVMCACCVFALLACTDNSSGREGAAEVRANSTPDSGAAAAERQRLLEADQAFSDTAADEGVAEAYRKFIASDAVQLPDGGMPLIGGDTIYSNMMTVSDGMDFSLSWQAEDAVVSAQADFGYTWGNYWYNGIDEDGVPYIVEGKYVNIWRKDEQDNWKVVLDMGNESPSLEADAVNFETPDEFQGSDYPETNPFE